MSILSYPFHSLPLKLTNKGMDFPFPPLKLPNKRKEKYSKIIFLFFSIPFHFLLPNKSLVSNRIFSLLNYQIFFT